jgi:high-affinity Fe2+/Pb2+ permease
LTFKYYNCVQTILFLFAICINIAFAFIITVFSMDTTFIIINVLSFIVNVVLLVLALFTLIKQVRENRNSKNNTIEFKKTCCIWNKNDREFMNVNAALESRTNDETDSAGQGINEEQI